MPALCVLGGCGFIGRQVVCQAISSGNFDAPIVVADKVLPDLAHMDADTLALFKDASKVTFVQANLASQASAKKVFEAAAKGAVTVNCAAETKYSQSDAVYQDAVIAIAKECAAAAGAAGCSKWIEVSTAQVYDASKKATPESGKLKPWTGQAKAKLAAEEEVRAAGLPKVTVLRPAVVYGPGDVIGLMPRVLCAATYTTPDAGTMEFLWDGDLRINTVHVADVVTAVLHCATSEATDGKTFNLADKSDSSQASINKILEEIFGIKTGFLGNLKSKAATSVAMKTVAAQANEKHMQPWSDLCKEKGVASTHLSPFLDEELLYNNSLAINGAAIEETGFSYSHPEVTKDAIVSAIEYAEKINAFPKGVRK